MCAPVAVTTALTAPLQVRALESSLAKAPTPAATLPPTGPAKSLNR
jgi:hypothetical protein